MEKKSVVMRVPVELVGRISQYKDKLSSNGINVDRTNAMRMFAGEAITPRDNISTFLSTLNRASQKKK